MRISDWSSDVCSSDLSVSKMVSYSTPPGYQRQLPIRLPKLDAFVSTIEHWLEEDLKVPRKQRHTAKRVFDRLRDERGFTGGYTIIKDYMRERDQRRQRSEEHTSELQSLMHISYAVFCLKKKKTNTQKKKTTHKRENAQKNI